MSNNTQNLLSRIKAAGQDQEWYPTDSRMINRVLQYIPSDAKSIMDIGAGDGRVLAGLAQKCKSAILYGIEQSEILVQAQPESVIPVGTGFFEQNLSCLVVDYIFCNPPYSQFVEWCCKIISEGYAKKAYLIIPQRWKDSDQIKESLKLRGAYTTVIGSDDFLSADRKARAVVDIVEVSFPRTKYGRDSIEDPFNIWFDQNIDIFDKVDDFKETTTSEYLAKIHANSSIDDMVESYRVEYLRMQENYQAIFRLDYAILKELGVDKNHVRDGLKLKMAGLKNKYWKLLFNRLDAITSRLSTGSRKALLEKLTQNTAVEFTVNNAYAVVIWAIKNANRYFDDQLTTLFRDLATFEGIQNYKSNVKTWNKDDWRYSRYDFQQGATHYALDYRIVIKFSTAICNVEYNKWQYPGGLYQDRHDLISDIIAVMGNLGFATNSTPSTERKWDAGKWQDWYMTDGEILFQVKAYLNGNIHMRFAPKAIMALNIEAGRLLKWVRTADEVSDELGYSKEDVKQYFKSNAHILPSNVKLLAAPKG